MNTDKYLLEHQKNNLVSGQMPVYYWADKTYSSQFYSKGKVKIIENLTELDSILNNQNTILFTIRKKKVKEIPEKYKRQFTFLDSNQKTAIYLYRKD